MKRTLPLFVLIAAIGLLVPVLAVFGKPTPEPYCVTCCPSATTAKSSSDNNRVIDELTAILKETKSSETFIVTAMVLGRMGPEAKRALPIIIRNAERLELLDDLYKANASAENRAAAQEVVAALEMILDKKAGAKGRTWANPAPTYYSPATGYSGASSGSSVCPAPTYAPAGLSPTPSAPSAAPIPPQPTSGAPSVVKPLDAVPGVPGTIVN